MSSYVTAITHNTGPCFTPMKCVSLSPKINKKALSKNSWLGQGLRFWLSDDAVSDDLPLTLTKCFEQPQCAFERITALMNKFKRAKNNTYGAGKALNTSV